MRHPLEPGKIVRRQRLVEQSLQHRSILSELARQVATKLGTRVAEHRLSVIPLSLLTEGREASCSLSIRAGHSAKLLSVVHLAEADQESTQEPQ